VLRDFVASVRRIRSDPAAPVAGGRTDRTARNPSAERSSVQPFLRPFTRTAGPDEAGRLILLVICQRCSSMVVPGWPCWHCANLNINALAIDRAREPGTGSLPVVGTAAITACEQITPSRPRRDRLRLNAGVA
jgi:hypothetical protein